jgi:flagellar protein FliT
MPETLFDYYQAIETASRHMLQAAQTEDWDQVVRYEGACAVLIEQLRHRAHSEKITPAQRKDKARIMQSILRNDAEIRLLAEPWLNELDHMLCPQHPQQLH